MKNHKLVNESLDEFIDKNFVNEGISNVIKPAMQKIKSMIKKIGSYYVAMYNDAVMRLTLPVNIGLNFKLKKMGDHAMKYFIPSASTKKLEPSLSKFNDKGCYQSVVDQSKRDFDELNKKYPTVDSYVKAHLGSLSESKRSNKIVKEEINEHIRDLKHYDKDVLPVNSDKLQTEINIKLSDPTSPPLLIWGAPGIGKTAIIEEVLEARNLDGAFISFDAQIMTPEAWFMPYIEMSKQEAAGYKIGDPKYVDLPKGNLPLYKYDRRDPEGNRAADEKVNDGEGGIIFFDELSRCTGWVQSSILTLMGSRQIAGWKLGSKWAIIAAANRMTDEFDRSLITFSGTLGNRLRQVNYEPTYEDWRSWAIKNGINEYIIRYLDHNYEEDWYTKRTTDENQAVFASPRSWTEVSRALRNRDAECKRVNRKFTRVDAYDAISGQVGIEVGLKMAAFMFITDKYPETEIANIWTNPAKGPKLTKIGKSSDALVMTEVTAVSMIAIKMKEKVKEIDPKEFTNFCNWVVSLDHAAAAAFAVRMLVEENAPYMHRHLGDYEGEPNPKYKEGGDILRKKYGVLWGADPDTV